MTTPIARLGRRTRWALAVAAVGVAGVLGVARGLEPDPRGFGTHQQLGLPPCSFQTLTGFPCPSCGMTTAFAWTTRGRVDRAWRANPAGALLAPACVMLVPWLLVASATGRTPGTRSPEMVLTALVVATVALSLVAWIVRFYTGRA